MKKGFIEISFLVFLFVLIFFSLFLLDIALNNLSIPLILKNKVQSRYYAETGMNYAIYKIKNKLINGNSQFYVIFKDDDVFIYDKPLGKSYAFVKISCTIGIGYKIFNISSKGYYFDYCSFINDQIIVNE